jgi:hypothetical protein
MVDDGFLPHCVFVLAVMLDGCLPLTASLGLDAEGEVIVELAHVSALPAAGVEGFPIDPAGHVQQ